MMYLILTPMVSMLVPWLINPKFLWTSSMVKSMLIALISMKSLNLHSYSIWHKMSLTFALDKMSSLLIILSTWLIPMSLLASIKTMSKNTMLAQQTFMTILFMMLFALMLTFLALELTLFYMAFETTLLPTLMLISRWGSQKERYQASMYFLFYTLTGSLPLLIAMISLYKKSKTTIFPSSYLIKPLQKFSSLTLSLWWMFCMLAFIMKMPIYGFHLWLPKAHVEAPVAGSMILAAILLKLGGYGLMRTITMFHMPTLKKISFPLITFCMWGALITSIMCLRQTDLKALMAYSSVGHMSLVASGVFSLSMWGLNGAVILMVAHGLMSSALFCLANLIYERKKTRTLAMTRGFKLITPLLSLWWMITCMSKLGLPPTPKLMGELFIISTIIDWKTLTTPIITIATVFSAMYSLLIFQKTNNSKFPKYMVNMKKISSCEHMLIFLHLFPLIFLIINPKLAMII